MVTVDTGTTSDLEAILHNLSIYVTSRKIPSLKNAIRIILDYKNVSFHAFVIFFTYVFTGSETNYLVNGFGIKVDFSWFSIVSSILSIGGMLNGALWVTEPLQKITDGWTAKIIFLPLFFYRMLAWLMIISILDIFSFLILAGLFILNSIVLLVSQHKIAVEPILQSILSLAFPVTR